MSRRLAVVSLICLGGCYGYYPPATPAPVGKSVEVTLSDSGSFALARQIGPSAAAINGRLTSDSASALILAVTAVRQRDGNEVDWKGERVSVPRPLVIKLEERRFSRARTTMFVGSVVVGILVARQALGGSGFSFLGSGQSHQGTTK
jgi:hypothetical protein